MTEKIIINNLGNFAHALPIRAKEKGLETFFFSDRSQNKILELSKKKKIRYSGGGLYDKEEVNISTIENLKKNHFEDVNYFILSNYATHHNLFFEKYGDFLNSSHEVILLSPGVGAAIEMNDILKKKDLISYPKITEVDTCPFACKVPNLGESYIKTEKNEILYTSIQGDKNEVTDSNSLIKKLFSSSKYIDNPLMNLDDSTCFHVVGMIVNSKRIKGKEDFNFYINEEMKNSSNLMVDFDAERCKVAERFNVPYRDIKTWLNSVYGVEIEDDLYSMISKTPPYMNTQTNNNRSPAPKTLYHRYLEEEVPLKLVPTYYLGKSLGLDMSLHEKFIKKTGLLLFNDSKYYFNHGRNISLG